MGDWNVGSVITEVSKRTDNIPLSISGTNMTNIVTQRLTKINNYLGKNYVNDAIPEAIQGPLVELTKAKVLIDIETQGSDASETKLGEFTIKKGKGSASLSSAEALEKNAYGDLRDLKGSFHYYKALG